MNLIKLFNPAYLKENIKKSRGFIILFLILVPLFTALVTILELNNTRIVNVADKVELGLINMIGMYVIPFVLSFSLFGYVYRKNSVDFINSMPLNRKTIFVTNTIGGILLITLMQFITAMILVICGAVLENIIIFPKLISDLCILMWISYVFVFIATNLAMTFSGTFLTQIALTLLILFLVPFCVDSYNEFSYRVEYNFVNGEREFSNRVYEEDSSYTMPYRLFHMLVTGVDGDIYNTTSIMRMIILGIFYFGIGMYLFQNRKMENTEESFSNIKMHIFVKALTIFPMIIVLNLMDPDFEFVIFAVALIIVYYFIFDFVVKRKVNLKVSIPCLFLILGVIQGICMGTEYIKEKLPAKKIEKSDIAAISIESCRNYSGGSWYYTNGIFSDSKYFVDNQEIIDIIYDSAYYVYQMNHPQKDYDTITSTKELTIVEEFIEDKIVQEEEEKEKTATIEIDLKTKSGKTIEADIEILETDFEKITTILEEDQAFMTAIKERLTHEGEMTIEKVLCNEQMRNNIRKEIKDKLEKMSLKEIFRLRIVDDCGIHQYYYDDHKLIETTISAQITDSVFKLAAEVLNEKTVTLLKEAIEDDVYYGNFYIEKELEGGIQEKYSKYIDFEKNSIANFILESADEEFDPTKDYYVLRGNVGNYNSLLYFYTNKTDKIDQLIEEKMVDDYEYIG